MNPIDKLKNKIYHKGSAGDIAPIFELAHFLGCIPDITGREFEVYDNKGKLQYRILQKPMAITQLNLLLKEFHAHKLREKESMKKKGK